MEWTPITSSVIARVRYDTASGTLDVAFLSGKMYRYRDVPAPVYDAFMTAESKGRFFNTQIRDRFSFEQMNA